MYAKKLTKEDLIRDDINDVKEDGTVIRNGYTLQLKQNKEGYFYFNIYNYDEEGNRIKKTITRRFKGCNKDSETYTYSLRTVCLHRAMWAWHYGEVPEGMVVDHVNNQHNSLEDYRLDNLQLLTPKENITKEKSNWHTYELKCKMNKPRSFYENKLKKYEELYTSAKLNTDPKACHKLRSNISQTRARLRYWDAHQNEYKEGPIKMKKKKTELQKDLMELAAWKKTFKENGNKKLWHECCKIEKIVKLKGEEAKPIVKHALEVCHKHFGG